MYYVVSFCRMSDERQPTSSFEDPTACKEKKRVEKVEKVALSPTPVATLSLSCGRMWHDNGSCGLCPRSDDPQCFGHFRAVHGDLCPICLTRFRHLQAMRQHYSVDHERWAAAHFAGRAKPVKLSSGVWFYEKPRCPDHDGLSFSTWSDLQVHMSAHGKRASVRC